MYHIRLLKAAGKELEELDKPVAKRIAERIHWLAENLEDVSLIALKGDLAGLYKLRDGDYRIIYEIIHNEKTIVIHSAASSRNPKKKVACLM